MLTTIVITAILTAAAVMALSHRGRSYIYNLEQTAMNQAEELIDLRDARRRLVTQLENERLNTIAASAALRLPRQQAAAAEERARDANRVACALRVELELMRHERNQLWGKLGMQPDV